MKGVLIILFLFFFTFAFGQGNFALLKRELSSFAKNDTAIVFGTLCNDCDGFSKSAYYLSTGTNGKLVVFSNQSGNTKKAFDSSFSCTNCKVIVDFAKVNYKSISNQFDSSFYLFSYRKVKGKDTVLTPLSDRGFCYFLGVYSKADFSYYFFSKTQNTNNCFVRGNYFWTYLNLLENQWLQCR